MDIVRHADRLGIPHFQRGAVWDAGHRTALLESIYEQSPCGSFVLWAPDADEREPHRYGVALRQFRPELAPMWLVDGQQRTRAMLGTFDQLVSMPERDDGWSLVRPADLAALRASSRVRLGSAEYEEEEDADDEGESDLNPWFVVLPAMPAFDRGREPYFENSESRNVRRGSIFRRLHPRVRTRSGPDGRVRPVMPHPVGLVPLAALLSPVGVFHDEAARAATALATFSSADADVAELDDLLPWGPQFVTGHAFETPGTDASPAVPMGWSLLHRRRGEFGVLRSVGRLAGLFDPAWRPLFERFRGMLDGHRFAVGWLPASDVSAAIDAYVRINRAGIRVRTEERALALLSRARPQLLDDLADFSSRRDGAGTAEDARALLAHASDRQMGFAVWMNTVTRYAALALLGDIARRWLGVAAIDRETFGYRLDRVGPGESKAGRKTWARPDFAEPGEVIRGSAEQATPALLLIDSVLSEELFLDHRMARPSARALTPLIDLFYRVPAPEIERLRGNAPFRAAIARLLHWTLLAPYIDQPDLEQLVVDLHGLNEEAARIVSAPLTAWDQEVVDRKLREALAAYQLSLLTLWRRRHDKRHGREPLPVEGVAVGEALSRLALDAFAADVRDARSLQHAAVGWLYAIERRRGAREFSWNAQVEGYGATGGKVGVPPPGHEVAEPLRRSEGRDGEPLYPEKQHIVPFAAARQIIGKGGTRSTSSPSNALGNLTWLSRRQNGLDALSDRWTVMDRERDAENLAARGMLAPVPFNGQERCALEAFESLRDLMLEGEGAWRANQAEAQRLFQALCDARASWVVDQMVVWLREPLSPEGAAWLGSA
jgi:hypothetical protein